MREGERERGREREGEREGGRERGRERERERERAGERKCPKLTYHDCSYFWRRPIMLYMCNGYMYWVRGQNDSVSD